MPLLLYTLEAQTSPTVLSFVSFLLFLKQAIFIFHKATHKSRKKCGFAVFVYDMKGKAVNSILFACLRYKRNIREIKGIKHPSEPGKVL